MHGFLKNKEIIIEKYTKHIEDENFFIAIDGIEEDELNIIKIRELYKLQGEGFVNNICGFFSIYLYDKKRIY